MPIFSVALFGSRARGDFSPESDVDILLITSDSAPRHSNAGSISLSVYPKNFLQKKATDGDLFVLHLITEGRVLYDEKHTFEDLRQHFVYKRNYEREISQASQVGWFIVNFSDQFESDEFINKKIAWSLRTILIARTAEKQHPKFAAQGLAEFAASGDVLKIIASRHVAGRSGELIDLFVPLLAKWGGQDKLPAGSPAEAYSREFNRDDNTVGMQIYSLGLLGAEPSYL